ncbi:MAG: hypothetical protein JJU11_12300 [Candidatus Sumerlaeia bacterium]|nr:hypothetical protein [Candidatus Sumerlaeia bacterium]
MDSAEIMMSSMGLLSLLGLIIFIVIPLVKAHCVKRTIAKRKASGQYLGFSFDELYEDKHLARLYTHSPIVYSLLLPWIPIGVYLYLTVGISVDSDALFWMVLFAIYATMLLYIFQNPYYKVEKRRLLLSYLEMQYPGIGNFSVRINKYVGGIIEKDLFIDILLFGCIGVFYICLLEGEGFAWMVACSVYFTLFVPIWANELGKTAKRLDRLITRAGDNYLKKINSSNANRMTPIVSSQKSSNEQVEPGTS